MKPLSLFALCIMMMSHICFAQSDNYKRYKIKSAIIEFKYEGSTTGTETLYFDDYGTKEAKVTKTEMNMMGMSVKEDKTTLLLGFDLYNINHETNTGTKMTQTVLKNIADGADGDLASAGEEMLKGMGGKKTGTDTFLGKTCDVWEISSMGTKSWVWNGIALKTTTDFMGMSYSITATDIQENASVPADKLKVPANVTISEVQMPSGLGGFSK